MPRNVTLVRNWRLSFTGCAIGGLLIGAVCGAGLAIAKVAPPGALLPATLGGGLLGVLARPALAARSGARVGSGDGGTAWGTSTRPR